MAQAPSDEASGDAIPPAASSSAHKETMASNGRSHFSRSDVVKLLVGRDQIILRAHRDLLCEKSEFFKGCLEGDFCEADHLVVSLPDDDPSVVEAFLTWAYTGNFSYETHDQNLAGNYKFADMIISEAYCNAMVDSVRASLKARGMMLTCYTVQELYDLGLQDTPLASFALKGVVQDMMSSTRDELHYETQMRDWFKLPLLMENFTKELLCYKRKPYSDPNTWKGCYFHTHKDGSKCSSSASSPK